MQLLNIESSPRGQESASIAVADAFLTAYGSAQPGMVVDRMNVWEEQLPEFDSAAIGAKYKAVSGEPMSPAETRTWARIQELAARFHQAERLVLSVPMWNFAYPYKLKQLIDLVSQRDLLFRFDGKAFGPMLKTPRALVIYSQGQSYGTGSPTPAEEYDHQTGYIAFWLRFVGVREIEFIVVDNAWSDRKEASVARASEQAGQLAKRF